MHSSLSLSNIERQKHILELLGRRPRITVAEICEQFSVSEATARRDLDALVDQGKVQRIHGGAPPVGHASPELPVLQRQENQAEEKQRIGRAAAGLVHDAETIFLGSGTTVLEVARHLPRDLRLTVITNSLPVVNELVDRANIDLIVIGGMLRQSEYSMIGHIAELALREVRADRVIMGMRAVDTRHGYTNDYLPETMTDRAIMGIASQIVVVVDHSKFRRVSSVLVGAVTAAHVVVTDQDTPFEYVEGLRQKGVQVIIV